MLLDRDNCFVCARAGFIVLDFCVFAIGHLGLEHTLCSIRVECLLTSLFKVIHTGTWIHLLINRGLKRSSFGLVCDEVDFTRLWFRSIIFWVVVSRADRVYFIASVCCLWKPFGWDGRGLWVWDDSLGLMNLCLVFGKCFGEVVRLDPVLLPVVVPWCGIILPWWSLNHTRSWQCRCKPRDL